MTFFSDKQPVSATKIDFLQCLAKTYTATDGLNDKTMPGRTVLDHCLIVGHIAQALLDRLPFSSEIRALFPEQTPFIAAVHDIGKISPTFFIKLAIACGIDWRTQYPELTELSFYTKQLDKMQIQQIEKDICGHARIGAVVLFRLLEKYCPRKTSKKIAMIVGEHHSRKYDINGKSATCPYYGGEHWQQGRLQIIDLIKKELPADFSAFQELTETQQTIILGLVVVADWIGSGSRFDDPTLNWRDLIAPALDEAGYIPFQLRKGLSFQEIFQFAPREAQQQFISICNKPGVYILEAPMGIGKTEAALYAAYHCLQQGQATGIYFALPTQLTSDKIHQRVEAFLQTILADLPGDKNTSKRPLLLHSNEWIKKTEMGEEGRPGRSWFESGKRGLLAPFAVGTLDQALLSVMCVRHHFVRAFGLLGKVVIIDEVHSYDTYTGYILYILIDLLRQMQCTVIILTATLTHSACGRLLALEKEKQNAPQTIPPGTERPYPLISYRVADGPVKTMALTPPASQQVKVRLQAAAELEIVFDEALQRAQDGQQVLWIENTVIDAQKRYFDLAARCGEIGVECGLLHSRFMPQHRETNEKYWVNILGKDGHEQRRQKGRLLIGTQVLEQSLDIDADFLVSRFAPVDLLLQRMGRLWRHADTPRPRGAQRESWILAPDLNLAINNPDAENTGFGYSALVYNPYLLCRSLETLQQKLAQSAMLRLPEDIRGLLESAYAEQDHQHQQDPQQCKLRSMYQDLQSKAEILTQRALAATATDSMIQDDQHAQTRYSEDDSGTILLFKKITIDKARKATILTLIKEIVCNSQTGEMTDKIIIPWHKSALSHHKWRELSCIIMQQKVPCRLKQLPDRPTRQRCEDLGFANVLYLGKESKAPFALMCRDDNGDLHCFEQPGKSVKYRYDEYVGLHKEKVS